MGLNIWFHEDVARILASTWETMQATAAGMGPAEFTAVEAQIAAAYERGFQDALRAIGVAFGMGGGYRELGNS